MKYIFLHKPVFRLRPGETVPAQSKRRQFWQPRVPGVGQPVGPLRRGEGLDARQPDHVCHQVAAGSRPVPK